jgi:hypothetical protein
VGASPFLSKNLFFVVKNMFTTIIGIKIGTILIDLFKNRIIKVENSWVVPDKATGMFLLYGNNSKQIIKFISQNLISFVNIDTNKEIKRVMDGMIRCYNSVR